MWYQLSVTLSDFFLFFSLKRQRTEGELASCLGVLAWNMNKVKALCHQSPTVELKSNLWISEVDRDSIQINESHFIISVLQVGADFEDVNCRPMKRGLVEIKWAKWISPNERIFCFFPAVSPFSGPGASLTHRRLQRKQPRNDYHRLLFLFSIKRLMSYTWM